MKYIVGNHRPKLLGWSALALGAALGVQTEQAVAQTTPDAGALLRQSREPNRVLPDLPPQVPPRLLTNTGVKVLVTRFTVEGSTRFEPAVLTRQLSDLVGKELGFNQLQAAADRIAAYYRSQGLHATVLLPEQDLANGIVRLVVVEGKFGSFRLDGSGAHLPMALVDAMIQRGQTHGEIIDTRALERGTLLANDLPGVRVSTLLGAGAAPGETDIITRVDRRPTLNGAVTVDNHDARATGTTGATLSAVLANLAGLGDDLQAMGSLTRGKRYGRLAYGVPVGASGLRGQLNASILRYKLVGDFAVTGAQGRANTVGARFTYPLVRGVTRNLYASAIYDHRFLKNDSLLGNLSSKKIDAGAFGLNGDANDNFGGGGAFVGNILVTVGRLDLSGNATDLLFDQLGPGRNGDYLKASATVSRLQRITAAGALWISVSGQVANKNLDSSEKFFLGGANGVRAYPALEASGDDGWLATVEYRHRLSERLQLSAYFDHGAVRPDHTAVGAALNRAYALNGVGLGAEWRIGKFAVLQGGLASRFGSNGNADPITGKDSDGSRRNPQVWAALTVPFSS